jgi:hypothetical protein
MWTLRNLKSYQRALCTWSPQCPMVFLVPYVSSSWFYSAIHCYLENTGSLNYTNLSGNKFYQIASKLTFINITTDHGKLQSFQAHLMTTNFSKFYFSNFHLKAWMLSLAIDIVSCQLFFLKCQIYYIYFWEKCMPKPKNW